jgi:Carboxypeptidase regulatory-like domain
MSTGGNGIMKFVRALAAAALVCGIASLVHAQGTQTGTIRGVVHDDQGLAVPGVTVTVSSPALQSLRSGVTDTSGGFAFPNLPPGDYTVKFELSGFATVTSATKLPLGLVVEQNVTLKPAGVAETVQVVAETPAPIATPIVGTNIKHDEVELLATPRTLQGIATLAPSVNENTPNGGQLAINGAFAFDNIFMVNGVDVNDNLFANPQNLFIEDAIEETQVLTSGISAEYGRFSGGVVNAITKSGGNRFTGSGRVNFLNPSWTDETPLEKSRNITRPSINQETYEGTFGGPIVKDHLWFFSAGRYAVVDTPATVQQTAVQVIQNDNNKRGELKLTGTIAQNHTIQGGYLNNARTTSNTSGIFSLIADPASLITRSLPNSYYYTNYRGVFGNNILAEAQYSQRHFEFQNDGIPATTDILKSPFFSPSLGVVYNSPYFCACDPEQRNNRQLTGAVTNFWGAGGRHQTKTGFEWFRSQRTGGNSQSPTTYVFNSDFLLDASGTPARDAQGRLIPVFVPGESSIDFYPAVVGATLNIDNSSIYAQDHWTINGNLSADIGARYEHVRAASTGNITSVITNRIVPRLALSYDVRGNGSNVVHVTYGQYSGRYQENQIGGNSPVGNPADIFSLYQGPAGQGIGFAPGLNVANYPVNPDNASITVPLANVFIDQNTKSALTHEVTASYGLTIANGKGYTEAAYIHRSTGSLIEDFITRADGVTDVVLNGIDAGLASNRVYRNTDLASRVYDGMVFQGRYGLSNRWSVNGQFTLELRNNGNYEGEGINTPGATSRIGDYPEALPAAQFYPDGRLNNFERGRLRAWSIYTFGMGRAGDLSLSGLWRYDTGQVYSIRVNGVAPTPQQLAILRSAGYADAPSSSSVYYGERGSQTFPGYGLLDFDLNYNVPTVGSVRPWVKFDVFNLLNNDKLISFNTTYRQDPNSPLDALGLRTSVIQGPQFGQATSQANFPRPFGGADGGRTFRVAVGLRF